MEKHENTESALGNFMSKLTGTFDRNGLRVIESDVTWFRGTLDERVQVQSATDHLLRSARELLDTNQDLEAVVLDGGSIVGLVYR
jgi:hypothetical protein